MNDKDEAKIEADRGTMERFAGNKKLSKEFATAPFPLGLEIAEKSYDKIYPPQPQKQTKPIQEAMKVFNDKMVMAEQFYNIQPIYYDKAGLWWIWNRDLLCWQLSDEVDITNALYNQTGYDTINSKQRGEILQALKQIGRKYKPLPFNKNWVQFKNKIVDVITGEEFDAEPNYFTLNPIPHRLSPEKFIETPVIDKIFEEWVGKDNIKKLYQIMAYCLLSDYPIHRLFCFIGGGMNGKSCFLRLIENYIGNNNVCSTELDTLLKSRFEVTRLHKKLVCIMGETNFNELTQTSILKKLTGQDMIGFEYKNKTPFEDKNYAKILISTNNLPETTDKTIGFYRRWLIVDFPNRFSEAKEILDDIPKEEYENLGIKLVMILKDLLTDRKFDREGSIEERQKIYEDKSNPFDKFFKENIDDTDPNVSVPKWEFEQKLNEWCRENKFREIGNNTISKKMKERGVEEDRPYIQFYSKDEQRFVNKQVRSWRGLKWK